MIKFPAFLLSILCVMLLAGCATGPSYLQVEPAPDKETVVFYRDSKFAGAAIKVYVKTNEEVLGALDNGGWMSTELEPGQVEVALFERSYSLIDPRDFLSSFRKVLEFEAEAGKVRFVEVYIDFDWVKGGEWKAELRASGPAERRLLEGSYHRCN